MRLALGTAAMLALTHASPNFLRRLAPWLYLLGIVLLLVVEVTASSARARSAGSIWGCSASSPPRS